MIVFVAKHRSISINNEIELMDKKFLLTVIIRLIGDNL